MTSDKKDDLDLDMDMGTDMDGNNDVIDVDGIDEPLSAAPLGGADEYDADEDDFADDEEDVPAKGKKKSGGMTKVVAPMLVLLAAAGAGGYIVMNPGLLGGGAPAHVQLDPVPAPTADTAMLPPPDIMPEMPPATELAVADVPPQPLPALNEAPADAAVAPVVDTPVDIPVADTPVVDAAAPEVLPETVTAETPVAAPVPEEPTVQEGAAQVLAGSDVAVAPEAMNVAEDQAPVVTPEIVPEVIPEKPAPVAEAAPAPVPTPVLTPEPPAAAAAVTEPTFVPASPNVQPALSNAPVEVANPAASPVMNAQEIAPAPVATPSTTVAAPTATSGQASAPPAKSAAAPASNVYYDSLSQVPTGAMATSVGPREINPVMEPASKMVIVNKDKGEGSEASLLVAANRALKLQRYDAALEMYDQLYAKNKRDVRILMGRAVAQQNMGLNESAIQSYEEVLALKPDNAEALVNMMGLVRKQYPEVALRRLLEMYSRHPNNAGIAAQIGITNAGLGHYDDAMRYLGIASTLEPRNAQHLFNMAVAADRQGNKSMAIQLYERALETDVMYGASRSVPRENIYDRLSVLRRS